MTLDISMDSATSAGWWPRSETDVIRDQVAGIDAWNIARRAIEMAEEAEHERAPSRETRLDVARRLDVIRRQQQAIIECTERQMRRSAHLLQASAPARAVIVHRNDWFTGKVTDGLQAFGIEVVARLDNGADAVGFTIAEQPDLLLVEDKLAMLSGEAVLRQVHQFAPHTISAAQVSSDGGIAVLLDAGARTAFTRRVPPADVAKDLAAFVTV